MLTSLCVALLDSACITDSWHENSSTCVFPLFPPLLLAKHHQVFSRSITLSLLIPVSLKFSSLILQIKTLSLISFLQSFLFFLVTLMLSNIILISALFSCISWYHGNFYKHSNKFLLFFGQQIPLCLPPVWQIFFPSSQSPLFKSSNTKRSLTFSFLLHQFSSFSYLLLSFHPKFQGRKELVKPFIYLLPSTGKAILDLSYLVFVHFPLCIFISSFNFLSISFQNFRPRERFFEVLNSP